MKCEKFGKEIEAKESYIKEINEKDENKIIYIKEYKMIKSNNNYFRIFKDNEDIKKLKLDRDKLKKFVRPFPPPRCFVNAKVSRQSPLVNFFN